MPNSRLETDIEYARDAIILLRKKHDDAELAMKEASEELEMRETVLADLEGRIPRAEISKPVPADKSKAKTKAR